MNPTAPSISIAIPAFNEEAALPGVLQEAQEVLKRTTGDWEILVINDGSSDRTGALADAAAHAEPRIRVIHHSSNQGFGVTLREVFTKPSKEWIFFIPGDGQIPASQLEPLWAWHDRADYILGWRVHREDPAVRKINAGVYNLLVSAVLGRRVHDVDSVVLFRRELASGLVLEARSVFIHAEFLLKAVRRGARWAEVPIQHRPRQGGRALGAKVSVIWQTFSELTRYALSRKEIA